MYVIYFLGSAAKRPHYLCTLVINTTLTMSAYGDILTSAVPHVGRTAFRYFAPCRISCKEKKRLMYLYFYLCSLLCTLRSSGNVSPGSRGVHPESEREKTLTSLERARKWNSQFINLFTFQHSTMVTSFRCHMMECIRPTFAGALLKWYWGVRMVRASSGPRSGPRSLPWVHTSPSPLLRSDLLK